MSKILQAPSDGRSFTNYLSNSQFEGTIKALAHISDERTYRGFIQEKTPNSFNRYVKRLQGKRLQGKRTKR